MVQREAVQMSEYIDHVATVVQGNIEGPAGDFDNRPHEAYVKLVRYVLAAMEQPSQRMIKAADALDKEAGPLNDHPATADEVWRAMITAELKDDSD